MCDDFGRLVSYFVSVCDLCCQARATVTLAGPFNASFTENGTFRGSFRSALPSATPTSLPSTQKSTTQKFTTLSPPPLSKIRTIYKKINSGNLAKWKFSKPFHFNKYPISVINRRFCYLVRWIPLILLSSGCQNFRFHVRINNKSRNFVMFDLFFFQSVENNGFFFLPRLKSYIL